MKRSDYDKAFHRLWWEYAKRSQLHKDFCDYLHEKKINPDAEAPKSLRIDTKTRYRPPMSIFLKFGNIHATSFEEYWARHNARKKARMSVPIIEYSEIVEGHMERCLDSFFGMNGREPTLDEFIYYFQQRMENDPDGFLYLLVEPYSAPVDDLSTQFLEIIKKKMASHRYVKEWEAIRKKRPRVRLDELKRYLRVYDYTHNKEQRMRWKEIAKKVYPHMEFDKDLKRMLQKDLENAENVIKNVERGKFPGKYSSRGDK